MGGWVGGWVGVWVGGWVGGQVEHTCLCAHMRVDVDTMQAVLEIREIVGLHWWGFHRIMTGLLG